MTRIRGMGRTLQRGNRWWIAYYVKGIEHRESAGKVLGRPDAGLSEKDATKALKIRLSEIHGGRWVGPQQDRVMLTDLLDALVLDYKNNGRKSLSTLEAHLKPLRAAFPLDAAIHVTETRIEKYKAERLVARAPATVNRELAALRRAFALAVKQRRISAAPGIEMLAENNARQGFAEPADFEAVVNHLPEYLQGFARFAYASGWRKGELKTLEWSAVDKDNTRVVLRREHSKNGEPRVIPLVGELGDIIARQRGQREYKTATGESALSLYVFHRAGQPIGDFRKAWAAACIAAGFASPKLDCDGQPVLDAKGETVLQPSLIFHDLRRSAVRNFDREGVTQSVAMAITGHKTASVYRRYRIVNEEDIRTGLERAQAGSRARKAKVVRLSMAGV
jgi:integrase